MTSKLSTKKVLPKAWFIKVRGSYLPNSWQGWLSYVPYVMFLIYSANYGKNNYDELYNSVLFVATQWLAAAIVMTWFATMHTHANKPKK